MVKNPLAFAAYRYILASSILLLFTFYRYKSSIINFSLNRILIFLLLGFTGYFTAQGLQFLGLYYLPAVTVTFILNLTPIFVLILSIIFLKEKPSYTQFIGILLTLCGVIIFFHNDISFLKNFIGISLTFISGISWAIYMIIIRYYLRESREKVLPLTSNTMTLGSLMLLGTAFLKGNIIPISFNIWIIILWLSIVNTALAFVLWNHALKTLKTYEQSILQNGMLIQITLLASIFLHEKLDMQKILGIIVVFIGILLVQLPIFKRKRI